MSFSKDENVQPNYEETIKNFSPGLLLMGRLAGRSPETSLIPFTVKS